MKFVKTTKESVQLILLFLMFSGLYWPFFFLFYPIPGVSRLPFQQFFFLDLASCPCAQLGVSSSRTDRRCGGVRQVAGANLVRLECKAFSIGGSHAHHALSDTPKGLAGVVKSECQGDWCYRAFSHIFP